MVVPDYGVIYIKATSYADQSLTMNTQSFWRDEDGRYHWHELHPHGLVEIIADELPILTPPTGAS